MAEYFQRSIESARAAFRDRFGDSPELIVRAPGRVNLIGEHTDYNGLPVLPFAIAQSHWIALSRGDGPQVELTNADPRYPERIIAPDDLRTMSPAGSWDNYMRAALLGLIESNVLPRRNPIAGLRISVTSDLPSDVGLSSSSALVVGFALAALETFGIACDRLHLAEILAEAERHVGTRGGGMDQAACLLGQAGHALKIDFFPLAVDPVAFEGNVCVYLSDSGVRVEKSGAGLSLYNQRPAECAEALDVFKAWAEAMGHPEWAQVGRWGDLLRPPVSLSHAKALDLIHDALSGPDVAEDNFKLRRRAEHVIAEGWRVEQAAETLRNCDWARLAELIRASHRSCRDLYEISCPEIEQLVEAAEKAGAMASRLTGAGFGGCTLHLVARQNASQFETEMPRRLASGQRCFAVEPSQGAEVFRSD